MSTSRYCWTCSYIILFSCCLVIAELSQSVKPPHIVFIVADDLGWNDVSWHNRDIFTPNLNSLAKRGVILDSSYVQPTCTPSRNSFMTGMFPFHTELQEAIEPSEPNFLPLKYKTLTERLKERGYATHAVGKWHLGYCNEKYTPLGRGFDSFLGFYGGSECHYLHTKPDKLIQRVSTSTTFSSLSHVLMSNIFKIRTEGKTTGRDFRFNTTVWRDTEMTYSTHAFTKRAIEVIKRHDPDVPLFLYLPFQAPHSPIQVPRKYEQLYGHIRTQIRRTYSGMVTALDEAVGNLTSALYSAGLVDNLLLVFTADNGGYPYMGGSNLPLRGGKNTIWEGGTRVPTFAFSPSLLSERGRIADGLFHAADWLPTLLEASGATPATGIDGISQWSYLKGISEPPRSEFVYNINPTGNGAIRIGDYKLIVGKPGMYNDWYPNSVLENTHRRRYRGGRFDKVKLETKDFYLFNIKEDPAEERDVANEYPHIVRDMLHRYKMLNATKVPPYNPDREAQADPELYGGFWSPGWC